MEKPKTIRVFDQLFPACLAMQMVLFWLVMGDLANFMNANPAFAEAGMTSTYLYGQIIFSLIGWLLLWHFISRRGSNVARWILTLFVVQSSLSTFADPSIILTKSAPHIALYGVNFVVTIAANLCLFLPGSAEWFASRKHAS